MNWLFVALLGGNLMTATFDKESECLGQEDITMRDQHVTGQCVNLHPISVIPTSGILLTPGCQLDPQSCRAIIQGTIPSIEAH
jgi:hypothetical protein